LDWERPLLSIVPDEAADASLDVDQLGSRIVGLAGRVAAATCRWLLLVAAFDRRNGHERFGLPSTARWLAHYCSLSRRTASDYVRVARALAEHDQLRTEMAAGRLSYSQARAISRLAGRGDPQLINELIVVAEHGTVRHLEDIVRGLRTVDDDERDIPASERERVTHRWRSSSQWSLSARLDPENGVLVRSALEAVARAEGINQTQALLRIAEIALAAIGQGGAAPSLRGDQLAAVQLQVEAAAISVPDDSGRDTDEPVGDTDESGRGPDEPGRDTDELVGGTDDPGGGSHEPDGPSDDRVAEREEAAGGKAPERRTGQPRRRPAGRITDGPGLPDRVLHRLLCVGRIRTVILDPARQPLDVGRRHRVVSDKLFTALLLRDGGCRHPGCGSRIGLEAHHVRHWINGGRTTLPNLVLLCRRHHCRHHDGEFDILPLGQGRFRFRRPDGRTLPPYVTAGRYAPARAPIEAEHPQVAADAATSRWDGTSLDLDHAVWALAPGLRSVGRAGRDPWAAA
jgi:hypothetical protein